jgi:hypothetical protein
VAPALADEDSTAVHRKHAIGVSAGVPQVLAFTWEAETRPRVRFQFNVGSVIYLNGINARLVLLPMTQTFSPYGFVGGGIFFGVSDDDWDGFESFGWFGLGLRFPVKRVTGFVELSGIKGSDDFLASPTGAVGILWQY